MKTSTKKKTAGAAGGAAAVAIAAAIALSGSGGVDGVEIPYSIEEINPYSVQMEITPPAEESVDIVELYCNGVLVDKALLPEDEFYSIPVVFSDLERLKMKMYRRGDMIGTAAFEGGKLYYQSAEVAKDET